MRSNRFYISIVLNCLLIFAAAFLFFYFLNTRQQPSTAAGVAVVAFLLVVRLIYIVNRSNRMLSAFLIHMQENDPSLSYTRRYTDKNFRGLNESLEKLIHEFKDNRIDLEVQTQYLEALLGNISTGIISFDDSGKIRTMNQAARNILATGSIKHLKEVEKNNPELGERMRNAGPKSEFIEQINSGGRAMQLSVASSQIKLGSETIHIISLNDISNQMEEQEIRSWKKLIRVINHEIMNSMTPIITLSMAIRRKMKKGTPDAVEDAVQSAGIIEERSSGLVNFIERYKKLTGLPPLKKKTLKVADLFKKVEQLYREELKETSVILSYQQDCTSELEADEQMIEQVLINLVKNAQEAVRDNKKPEINLSCYTDPDGRICLSVKDNGEGIQPDKLEQVFVPFFTTREEGSGIGLSLCRQIIRLHEGQIIIESELGEGTQVVLRF
jgi:nitrogen fixation/metabolism regulation signal transduction histidine kinase